MLQDIKPHIFNNEFKTKTPNNNDLLLIFDGSNILMDIAADKLNFPTIGQIMEINSDIVNESIYLFSFDEISVFMSLESMKETEKLKYVSTISLRDSLPAWMTFIGATANHLANWYETNKFCGRCSTPMNFSEHERALCCKNCGLIKYPTISPAIIVGIINNDKILLTRYADRPYKKLSLVAGFVEIGETIEDTIRREVMEEVGLKIKNLQYYKSQPWAFSQSILMGFFAELDGDQAVTIDKNELSEAHWYSREEIPPCDTTFSLTNEMIEQFRNNKFSILSNAI